MGGGIAHDLRAALEDGRVIRTHVLRPTWHYVLAEDVGWLLELTAPRVRQTTERQLQAVHGLDDRRLDRVSSLVIDVLGEHPDLTRGQIADQLRDRGVDPDGGLMTILLGTSSSTGSSAAGVRSGTSTRTRCSPTGCRTRAGRIGTRRSASSPSATSRGTGRRPNATSPTGRRSPSPTSGKAWISPATGSADIVPRARESSTGMALVDAQLLAAMRRTVTTDRVAFELAPYRDLRSTEITALRRAAERYGEYLDLDPALELP